MNLAAAGSAAILATGIWLGSVSAAVVTYNNQATFQAQFAGGDFTLANLDAAPLIAFPAPYRVEDAGPAAAFLALGIDFFGVNAQVIAGQNGQTVGNRDRLIANGTGFDGEITINFSDSVNGVGAFSNNIDFGRVRVFSGLNLGGDFLGQVQFGPGGFGGLTSTDLIRSAHFTCDFNADLKCGVFDIQFGAFGAPEPAPLALMALGLATLLSWRVRAMRLGTPAVRS